VLTPVDTFESCDLEGVAVSKQTAGRKKAAARNSRSARPRRHGKVVHGHKNAPKITPAPATAIIAPMPKFIEILELDFVNDADEVPEEVAFVTELEDEDL